MLYVNRDWLPLRGVGVIALAVLAAAMSAGPLPTRSLFALAVAYAVLWLGFTDRIRLPDLAARGDLSYGTYLFAFPASQIWVIGAGTRLALARRRADGRGGAAARVLQLATSSRRPRYA